MVYENISSKANIKPGAKCYHGNHRICERILYFDLSDVVSYSERMHTIYLKTKYVEKVAFPKRVLFNFFEV